MQDAQIGWYDIGTSTTLESNKSQGGVMRDVVPVHREARQIPEEWRKARQDDSPALFLPRTGRTLSRREE